MRAFVALEIPGWYADEVAAFARELSFHVDGRFTPRENYHVTLAFLGNATEGAVRGVMDVLDDLAYRHQAAALAPDRLGKFGRRADSTLWLGFHRNEALDDLARDLRDQLEWRGIDFDRKAFLPHLTLARRVNLDSATALPEAGFPGRCRAYQLTLFKSQLAPEGATYQPLYSVELPDLPR